MSEEIKKDETGAESATSPQENNLTIEERVANFNTELKVILGKYNLALGAEAKIVDGKVLADPKVLDASTLQKQ